MEFKREDCVIVTINLRNPGGQHVGTMPVGIKVVHEPTGLSAYCDFAHSPHKNREIAMSMLEWGVICL